MSDEGSASNREVRRGSARAKLLAAAAARFYAQGVTASGIDVITADAGVAKMSLYNNFASKSELVAAYLEQRQQEFRDQQRRRSAALPPNAGPGARVLTVFDAYIDQAEASAEFRGCGLLNVAGELAIGDPNRERVSGHKAEVEHLLRDAFTPRDGDPVARPVVDADRLAEHLATLLEGAMVRAGLEGSTRRLHRTRELAAALLNE